MPGLDTGASTIALGQLQSLPFENIIGGPLTAAIKAQALAAQTTTEFIKDVGLQEANGRVEAINVEFTYQDGSGTTRRVVVPILTILPIPFIVIDTVDIQFKARIAASAQQSSEERKQQQGRIAGYKRWGTRYGPSAALSASYSAKKDSKASQESKYSVEYTMDVHVHASQAGIPQGMAQILNILQDGITNTPEAVQINIFGLPSLFELDANGAPAGSFGAEKYVVLVTDELGDPVSKPFKIEFEPPGIFKAPAVTENPATLDLDTAPDPAVAEGKDQVVTATVTANPGDPNEFSTTREILVRRAAAT